MADNLFLSYAYMLRQQAKISQLQSIDQSVGTSSQQMQAILQMQTMRVPQGFEIGLFGGRLGSAIGGNMSQPGMSHIGVVREFRRKFKEYTKAEFREMGSQPVIKEILSCMTKLNKEQIQERIAEHLATV